jgi:Flp pilus assembly protein TadG
MQIECVTRLPGAKGGAPRGLSADDTGSVAVIFCFAFMVLAFASGIALDFARALNAQTALQSAMDSSVLAAAKLPIDADDAEIQSKGESFFDSMLASYNLDGVVGEPLFARSGGLVQGSVAASVETTLTAVLGYPSMPVTVQSTAAPFGKGMELMLVVDVSGSMDDDDKIGGLRTAATALIDAIYGSSETRANTWIGITPFSGRVNIFDYGSTWMTGTGPGWASKLCTDRRSPSNVQNDEPPATELFPYYWATSGYGGGDGTETCPAPKALGLTAEKSIIQARIDSLVATAGTSTQEGMAWGWRMLSPKWQALWGNPDLPKAYADSPGKYVIIMTDGENFTWESGDDVASPLGDAGLSDDDADQRLLDECTAMKAEGITIFTVAFDMGSALTALYQQCATKPGYHFDVQSSSELIETFETLGLTLAGNSVRLVN